jgi:hypothetical protein
MRGVDVGLLDTELPILSVHAETEEVLLTIARLPFVDYIEPAYVDVTLALPGCDTARWTKPSSTTPEGDVVPWSFASQGIRDAWRRSTGRGITVGCP